MSGHGALNPGETVSDDGYDVLRRVLARAVEQASAGKGRERHAHDEPFDQQKIVLLGKWSGGTGFDVGQACKKALESTRLPKERAVAELLGAINYLAAAVILLEGAPEPVPTLTEQVNDLIARGRAMHVPVPVVRRAHAPGCLDEHTGPCVPCGELGPWSAVAGGRGCDKTRGHDGLHRVQTTHEGQAASW